MAGKASTTPRFAVPSRILHWLMAPMVIAQLLIGVTMVASLSYYPLLLAIHRPLGVLILIFAVIRLANRLTHTLPPFLESMGPVEDRSRESLVSTDNGIIMTRKRLLDAAWLGSLLVVLSSIFVPWFPRKSGTMSA